MASIVNQKISTDFLIGRQVGSLGITEYSLAVPELEILDLFNFYRLHLAIWQMRVEDLQVMFDIESAQGRMGFLAWSVSSGMIEYKALRELRPFNNELILPASIPETQWSTGISRLIQLAVFATPELNLDFRLATEQDQLAALNWYFCKGGHISFPTPGGIPGWQRGFLLNHADILASNLAKLIYGSRPDVRSAFKLESVSGVEEFRRWIMMHGLAESGLVDAEESPDEARLTFGAEIPLSKRPFGINLIGYAFGELGIGEDVRMAAKSLYAAAIPFTVINYEPGSSISQNDRSIEAWVGTKFRFSINVFCLTALEHFRFYVENGSKIVSPYYNIGYWPWELHKWPANWNHCFLLVDEVWASSEHIINSVRSAGFENSTLMPMAVSTPEPTLSKSHLREMLNIHESTTAFIFSFDGNSSFRRKNPLAILTAFNQAFPKNRKDVALVIKCMRADPEGDEWLEIQSSAELDERIIIINEVLTKAQVIELYRACDCFVSLHRAEGFGRGIAEALLLDLDVVTTNYGGNIDFCRPMNSLLVDFELIETTKQCYVESDGNFWAEPMISHAASHLHEAATKERALYRKRDYKNRISKLQTIFSHEAVGSRYSERLSEINTALHLQSSMPPANH